MMDMPEGSSLHDYEWAGTPVEDGRRESDPYRSMFDNAVVGIYQTTVDGRYLRVNPALARIYGYETPEALIRHLTDIAGQLYVDAGDRALFAEKMARDGKVQQFEARVYRRDGSILWILEDARCVRDADGAILYYEGVVTDITGRRQVEQKNRLLATVFESVVEGIVVIDDALVVQAANPAFEIIVGQSREDLIGRPLGLLGSGASNRRFLEHVCAEAARTGRWEGEAICWRQSGDEFPARLSTSVVRNPAGGLEHHVLVCTDITVRKQQEERIRYQANYDALTALPNRRMLHDRLGQAIVRARQSGNRVVIAFLDLDRFKQINDTLGHRAGDDLLRLVARRLRSSLRHSDTVGRFGGDEFIVVAPEVSDLRAVEGIAEKIVYAFSEPFPLAERTLYCSPSIGLAVFPDDGDSADVLIRNADAAMFEAKRNKPRHYARYQVRSGAKEGSRLDIEHDLRGAVGRGEFDLYFQPKLALGDGTISGAEALIRWHHPRMGLVSPAQFIPIAEDTGVIHEIGQWTLAEACAQLGRWRRGGLMLPSISVNLSPRQFNARNIISLATRSVAEAEIEAGLLDLELTESAMTVDIEGAVQTMTGLKRAGVRLSIDDFGTGYSSLSYLKRFPIDTLKVDRSFVKDLDTCTADRAIVEAVVTLGRSLGCQVVAEGVETVGQREALERCGCTHIQGYLISPPLAVTAFERFMAGQRCPAG